MKQKKMKGKVKGMNVAYVRVSSADQNEQRQIEGLQKYNIERWYTEKVSGKDTNRPELKKMLEYVREGDTIYIHDFSRLARSTKDLLNIVEQLQEKGVHLVSNKKNLKTLLTLCVMRLTEFDKMPVPISSLYN